MPALFCLLRFVNGRLVFAATIAAVLMSGARSHEFRIATNEVDLQFDDTSVVEHHLQQECECTADRLWTISTRRISSDVCRANLQDPQLSVYRLSCGGRLSPTTFTQYMDSMREGRNVVIYVHGNRLDAKESIERGLKVFRNIRRFRRSGAVDWVIWSWPSAKEGTLISDARRKARRTDAQGLYLSWVLREHAQAAIPTALIGYSFGGRVITGALHALAGGKLGGRALSGPIVTGMAFEAGLVAPAIETNWMTRRGYHSQATKNLENLLLLYNRRDAVLKRYWLIDRVRGSMALGYSGPRAFAPRADGSKLPIRARDCSPTVRLRHDELDYYGRSCRAGSEMAALIDDIDLTH